MKTLRTMMTALLAVALLAGCDDGKKDNDEDTGTEDSTVDTTDDTVEDTAEDTATDVPEDTAEDTAGDTPEDTATDMPTDETDAADGPPECPPDDATHNYINILGMVNALGDSDPAGMSLTAVAPVDALMPPVDSPLATTTVNADGTFAFYCIDVASVALGITVLADDAAEDGVAGTYFPNLTGVAGWDDAMTATDVTTGVVFALENTVVGALETLAGIDAETDGMTMGIVADRDTLAPIEGATVVPEGGGTADVVYPLADLTGLTTTDATSPSGMYVFDTPLGGLSNFTAEATGYTFDTFPAATPAGMCFFLPFLGASS